MGARSMDSTASRSFMDFPLPFHEVIPIYSLFSAPCELFSAGKAHSAAYRPAYAHSQERHVKAHLNRSLRSIQRSILAGIITVGPLFVTYLIFSFLLGELV